MRYSVTGIEQSTNRRVTIEVVCDSEQEATASAELNGIAVEQVAEVRAEVPKDKLPARSSRQPVLRKALPQVRFGPEWGCTWGYAAGGFALIAGSVYLWVWKGWPALAVLVWPFAAVLLIAAALNRRTFLELTDRGVMYRRRLGQPVHIPYIRIFGVTTRHVRTEGTSGPGVAEAIVLELEKGDPFEITDIARMENAAREIATRSRRD